MAVEHVEVLVPAYPEQSPSGSANGTTPLLQRSRSYQSFELGTYVAKASFYHSRDGGINQAFMPWSRRTR